jgi:hypothetical protein
VIADKSNILRHKAILYHFRAGQYAKTATSDLYFSNIRLFPELKKFSQRRNINNVLSILRIYRAAQNNKKLYKMRDF